MIKAYQNIFPTIHDSVFIEESAQVIGDVTIDRDSSVWFQAVVRGDVHFIRIGARSNIQDGAVLHVTRNMYPLIIEDHVSIGHNAVVHGCTIRSNCLIGMGAIVLDNADVGENCIIGAGAVVKEGMKIPPNSLVAGVPGVIKRQVTAEEIRRLRERAEHYVEYKNAYRNSVSPKDH